MAKASIKEGSRGGAVCPECKKGEIIEVNEVFSIVRKPAWKKLGVREVKKTYLHCDNCKIRLRKDVVDS